VIPKSDPNLSIVSIGSSSAGSSNPTSVSLLQRARVGDQGACSRLVQLYTPLAHYWCRRMGVRRSDADDVVQEVFGLAFARIAEFRRSQAGDTLRGWLRGITRNKVLELYRRSGKQPEAVGGSTIHQRIQEIADSEGALGDEADDAEVVNELYGRALDLVRGEFEPVTWKAFWRTTVDAQRPVDVAGEVGLSAAAVRMAKSRVLRRIREELGDVG
jgi:RNA polymerase sigma-70 factor (ECF subfamily)